MRVETQLAIGWLLFGGTHILGSSVPVRRRLIDKLGFWGFKGLYALVALATFVPLVWIAWNYRHEGALIYDPPLWTRYVTEVLMLLALLFLVLAIATPGPATTASEVAGRFSRSPRGIQRITRHPMNTGFGLFGLAHMVSNPTMGDWVFWGGFVVHAVISAVHQDRRVLAAGAPEYRSFYDQSSLVPFAAVLGGKQRLVAAEISWGAVALAVVLFALIFWLHPTLIGGFR